jgi:general secretion pathway protein N
MRICLPLGRSLFFLSFFLFALVALLPLGLALRWLSLDARGLSAREAQGSIWLGALREARFGSVPLGDLQARLRSLPLFIGRARVDLRRLEGEGLSGGIAVSRHAFGVDDVTADLSAGPALAPLPVASLNLTDVSAHFADGLCASAEGLVKASLTGEAGGAALPAGLSGEARCDGGALLLPLASQSGMERLDVRLFDDGRYRFELLVRPSDDAARQRLVASGFAPAGAGYVLRAEGRF